MPAVPSMRIGDVRLGAAQRQAGWPEGVRGSTVTRIQRQILQGPHGFTPCCHNCTSYCPQGWKQKETFLCKQTPLAWLLYSVHCYCKGTGEFPNCCVHCWKCAPNFEGAVVLLWHTPVCLKAVKRQLEEEPHTVLHPIRWRDHCCVQFLLNVHGTAWCTSVDLEILSKNMERCQTV